MTRRVLIRFLDGPLAGKGNLRDATGAVQTFTFPEDTYGWPLPDQLCVLAHLDQTANVAIWDPETEAQRDDPLPVEFLESANRVTYRKVSESKLRADQLPPDGTIARGAEYKLVVA